MVENKIALQQKDLLLLKKLKSGDKMALKQIIDFYCRQLHETALFKLNSEEKAKVVVREVFISLWDTRDSLMIDDLGKYLMSSLKTKVIWLLYNEVNR
jgi:hypothetical protein